MSSEPKLPQLSLKLLVRSWGEDRIAMVIGTSGVDLPEGDYALEMTVLPVLPEEAVTACAVHRFRKVPEGVIPPGLDATKILTSGIDLSDEGIERALVNIKVTNE